MVGEGEGVVEEGEMVGEREGVVEEEEMVEEGEGGRGVFCDDEQV